MKLERAIEIALAAHSGQTDKGGKPYILHPLRLMLAAKSDDEKIVAVLHDVIEDSHWTMEELRIEGLTEVQADALLSVTRQADESYEEFILRSVRNPIGRAVKILDLRDNSDLGRIAQPGQRDLERMERYRAALSVLERE